MIETITSTTNKKAQHIKSLLKNKPYRYEHRQFVVEGVNIVKDIQKGKSVVRAFGKSYG